jgi:plastocyanin
MIGLAKIGLVVALLTGAAASRAAVSQDNAAPNARFRVKIVDFAFTPKNMQVRVGDTITWTNNGAMVHTATANNGHWNSGNLQPGQSFTFRFMTAGLFPYRCNLHPLQMTGNIRVVAPE